MTSRFSTEARINEKVSRLISYLLVAAMMTCASLTLVALTVRMIPAAQPWYLAGVVFLVTLDRLYTYRNFQRLSMFSREWTIAYVTQWVMIMLVIKIATGLARGLNTLLAEVPYWLKDFLTYFTTPEFLFVLCIVIIIWVICGYFADMLDEMGLDQSLIREEEPISQMGETPARERLLNLIASIGTLLVVLTALTRFDLRAILSGETESILVKVYVELPALAGGGGSTLLYFMFALALLSQSQFLSLHARWSIQRIPVNREVAGRWAIYSLMFLIALAAIVSLLPTSYSLGLLSTIGYFLGIISSILFFILQFIFTTFFFILTLLFSLFGRESPLKDVEPATPQFQPLPVDAGPTPAGPVWWDVIKSLFFWVIFLSILIFSVTQYLRQHEGLLEELKKLPGGSFLVKLWQWLKHLFGNVRQGLAQAIETSRERARARRAAQRELFNVGFLNLRRLNPRQKVLFFYQALIRRSSESGLPRSRSQTPSEFATTLDSALPEAEPDVEALTNAFIEARYTPRPVEAEKANQVREYWEHLKRALRGKKMESGK